MGISTISRDSRKCVLCKYWNGAIGSTTIQIQHGGYNFIFENRETHACFKKGRGMQTTALQECSCFAKRYDD